MATPTYLAVLAIGGALLFAQPALAQFNLISPGSFDAAFADWKASTIDSVDALRVSTRQNALAGQQMAESVASTAQATLDHFVATSVRLATHNAQTRFHNDQTAANGLCAYIDAARANDQAKLAQQEYLVTRPEFESQWVQEGADAAFALMQNEQVQKEFFCTPAEAAQGLCAVSSETFGAPPGGGSSSGPWLTRRSYGNMEAMLASIYLDTIAPMPTISAPERRFNSIEDIMTWAEARRRAALLSMARASVDAVVADGVQGFIAEDGP